MDLCFHTKCAKCEKEFKFPIRRYSNAFYNVESKLLAVDYLFLMEEVVKLLQHQLGWQYVKTTCQENDIDGICCPTCVKETTSEVSALVEEMKERFNHVQ